MSFQTEIGKDLNYTSVNISEEKSTKHLKNETDRTNKRKRGKKSIDIENGETAAKRCKILDPITCCFKENVSLLRSPMKSSEPTEPVIKRNTELTKITNTKTNLVCPKTQNQTVPKLNEDYRLDGSVCQNKSTKPLIEVETSPIKSSYTSLTGPRKEKPRITDINDDCNPNGSICQNKVLRSDDYSKKLRELKTAKHKYYWGLEYLEYDSDALVIDESDDE